MKACGLRKDTSFPVEQPITTYLTSANDTLRIRGYFQVR